MAFFLDSFLLVSAAILLAASVYGWRFTRTVRPAARFSIRFALTLFAALGVAGMAASILPPFQPVLNVVALLAASLGSMALGLGLFAVLARPISPATASCLLALALVGGLGASLIGAPVFALVVQGAAACAIAFLALARFSDAPLCAFQALAGAFALICGGMALMDGAAGLALLFFTAALPALARASQLGVEHKRGVARFGVIG